MEDIDDSPGTDPWFIKKRYIPEVVLAYITVVQSAAYFTNRDLITKAMDIATLVADPERDWLQAVFMGSARMTELVDMLAETSKAMLRMGEIAGKTPKRRGSSGATVKVWIPRR